MSTCILMGMLAVYVNLKQPFDTVHREALLDHLQFCGVLGLLAGLVFGSECCGVEEVISIFPVNT